MDNFGIDSSAYAGPTKPAPKPEKNPNSVWLMTLLIGLAITAVLAVLSSLVAGLIALVIVMALGTFITMGISAIVAFLTSDKS